MKRLVRAEVRKLSTIRALQFGVGLVAVTSGLSAVLGLSNAGTGSNPPLGPDTLGDAVSGVPVSLVSAIVLVLAILGLAGEFHHRTITQTFLVTPRRSAVVVAKLTTSAVVGAALGGLAVAVTVMVVVPWLLAESVNVSILDAELAGTVAGILISTALYGVVGTGVAALVRNQTAAVAAAVFWIMGVEGLLLSVLQTLEPGLGDDIGKWLPGGAAAALAGGSRPETLATWTGGLLFAAYGLTFAALGARLVMTRDVT
jgi:ABC-2 type transport system permease protein